MDLLKSIHILLVLLLLYTNAIGTEEHIRVEDLKDELFYFPAKKRANSEIVYQPLKRFDLIFVGYVVQDKTYDLKQNVSRVIPGYYIHVLMYIGKDSEGFAYAVEMHVDHRKSFTISNTQMQIDGSLQLLCLGNDYHQDNCPNKYSSNSIKNYDYMWAKRLRPQYKEQLISHMSELLQSIDDDLQRHYPFKLTFHFPLVSDADKVIYLKENRHKDGADCVSYFTSLLQESADLCFSDIRITAVELQDYYTNDPLGREAILPQKYNFYFHERSYVKDLFEKHGYYFKDDVSEPILYCDGKKVIGVATPERLFYSKSLEEIDIVTSP